MPTHAPKLYFSQDGKTANGPVLPIVIDKQIRANVLPANVLVCEEGHDVWTDFATWQRAKTANMLHGMSPWFLTGLCVVGIIVVLILTIFACIFIWTFTTSG
jgi:hypothetical protein